MEQPYRVILLLVLAALLSGCLGQQVEAPMQNQDQQTGPFVSKGLDRAPLSNSEVLAAMSHVPRHEFVPPEQRGLAYEDRALPIGSAQTISQPYIVALMTQEAAVSHGSKVLEIGTGSGYQAAVLAELGARVFSIEIVEELAEQARSRLAKLGYDRVTVRQGDGWQGWAEEAPFDSIIVTAAAPEIPPPLLQQLAHRGRLVIPVRDQTGPGENLLVIERDGDDFTTRSLGSVRFVPLTGAGIEGADSD